MQAEADAAVGATPTLGGIGAASAEWLSELLEKCPCRNSNETEATSTYDTLLQQNHHHRRLADTAPPMVWETVVVSVTLALMLLFMSLDKIGPDWVMVTGLVVFIVTEIVTAKEGLAGFSNDGVLTVMSLFIVAEGVSRTGALDYYMGLLLGSPKTIAGAQLRLLVPVAILSAFLNNTPIVVVMIPLTLRWAKKIGVPKQQLLMPLSYATILGGTCTLVGTSTNLVVAGLLKEKYPNEAAGNIGLFDLAVYGVPNAMIGLAYMLACAPLLLPFRSYRGKGSSSDNNNAGSGGGAAGGTDDLLLGARVKPWSPAAGRTYKRSGLGNSGGIYLANVRRGATGNVHTAVSKDFVISVGDELYFTGLVENFGEFCEKHGLEIITKDNLHTIVEEELETDAADPLLVPSPSSKNAGAMKSETGKDKEMEQRRMIRHLSDQIGGLEPVDAQSTKPATVAVALDETEQAVLVGVDGHDRPGLLMDISDALHQQGLNLRHSEAKVCGERSLSVWGCEPDQTSKSSPHPDLEEIWSVVQAILLSSDQAVVAKRKTTGTRVVRAVVTQSSSLIGKKPTDVEFRRAYMASVVAYQKNGKNYLLDVAMGPGDLLVLETMQGSPLLAQPPAGFYHELMRSEQQTEGLYGMLQRKVSSRSRNFVDDDNASADIEGDLGARNVWKDLKVLFGGDQQEAGDVSKGEFLTAFTVTSNSPLLNKSLNDFGYSKLPGVVLISVERPTGSSSSANEAISATDSPSSANEAISADDPLQVGDIFWYSGSAEAIADLQRLHGLVFYHDEQFQVHGGSDTALTERRLVQAVVARGSSLCGQTVKDVHFRSAYGGVVIAIQRGSERVHEHPANVKLQTGDVLLVEASSSFAEKQGADHRTFALVSEVENSSPPRPRLFLLCAALMIAMLAVAGLGIRSLLSTSAIVGIIMVCLGIVTQQEARDCLQWDLYVTIASAFGIGTAMNNSGVAAGVATFLVRIGTAMGIGDAGVYGAVYFAGNLLSAVLTNNAAATLMFPIAMSTVDQTGTDRLKMCYILMLSSSDYITSFGYQTNLMVYGPGEYRNIDFFKFGAPMQILLWLSSIAMVATLSVSDPKWIIAWIVCAIGLAVVAVFRLTGGWFRLKRNKQHDEDNEPTTGVLKRGTSWQLASNRSV